MVVVVVGMVGMEGGGGDGLRGRGEGWEGVHVQACNSLPRDNDSLVVTVD